MSYYAANDELFFADRSNEVVRALRMRDSAGDLRDVYRAPHDPNPDVTSVCHLRVRDSDTLLVCSRETNPDGEFANWLVALSREGGEWREAHRLQVDETLSECCALNDSRVLVGGGGGIGSTFMELFRVESDPLHISRLHRIRVPDEYFVFSATSGSDTRVATSHRIDENDDSVRVHRLLVDRLEEVARIESQCVSHLLWLADRLLVAEWDADSNADAVVELEVSSDRRLERRRELVSSSERISVWRWCALDEGLAIFDFNSKDLLLYSLTAQYEYYSVVICCNTLYQLN